MAVTDNYRKHTSKNPLQKYLINKFFKILIAETGNLEPVSILDVGCGEGFTLDKFKKNHIGKELVGVDSFHRAIEIGKEINPDLNLKYGDIYNLPFKNNSFDVVTCTEVLEHLTQPEKALEELIRVSRRYCILSVPHEPWFMLGNLLRGKNISRFGNDIEHVRHWTSGGFKKFVSSHLQVLKTDTPLPWTIIVAEKRKS